ncbi:tetratricopeptide repeat protein [Clostridium tetani]|uniref:tetratricopeptide repeat protein n=1 Tax=Clostridium tetani TaxID=1513 RepID=UPI00068CE618|nr:hypothetical protein [Clostridium tetani]RXI73499.1 tetratricopeptide repeat protein [Clostridium tetani]BDR76577.1 hypothetical protein K154306013_22370 [Clostridium tetani]BDR87696.1 hypothetical protein N071400001_23040 [Clostridium tetani]
MDKNKILKIIGVSVLACLLFAGSMFGTYKIIQTKNFNDLVMLANEKLNTGNYDEAIELYEKALNYKDDRSVEKELMLVKNYKQCNDIYNKGIKLMNDKKYSDAIQKLSTIEQWSGLIYTNAQSKIEECKKQIIAQNIKSASEAAKNGKYDDANKYLDQVLKLDNNNSEAKKLKDEFAKTVASNINIETLTVNKSDSRTGNIKGIITWQYNNFIGTKPDTGANITLISKNKNRNNDNSTFAITLQQVPNGKNGIYTAKADGYGNYEIDSVPTGEYYLLITSNNTNSDMTIDSYTASTLQGLFSEQDWSKLQLALKLNKYRFKTIKIKAEKTIIESYDFGYTYF